MAPGSTPVAGGYGSARCRSRDRQEPSGHIDPRVLTYATGWAHDVGMTPTTDRRHDLRLHTEDQLQGLIAHATEILRNRDEHDDATVRLARRLLSEANTELLGRGVR